jgi:hypothetical protein
MFAVKPPDAWDGLDTIVEECERRAGATSSGNITLADVVEEEEEASSSSSSSSGSRKLHPRSPHFTLDLCSSQTPEEESQFHKARVPPPTVSLLLKIKFYLTISK